MNLLFRLKKLYKRKRNRHVANRIDVNALKNVFILSELKNEIKLLQVLLSYCHILSLEKNCTISQEGEPSNAMYILLEGTIRILKKSNSDEQFLLKELNGRNNVFFGEMGLVRNELHNATVKAVSDVKLLVLSRKNFIRMTKKQPAVAVGLTFSICRVLADRLQKTNDDLAYLYDALAHEATGI